MCDVSTLDIELRKATQYNLLLIIEVRNCLKWYFRFVRCVQEYYCTVAFLTVSQRGYVRNTPYAFIRCLPYLYIFSYTLIPDKFNARRLDDSLFKTFEKINLTQLKNEGSLDTRRWGFTTLLSVKLIRKEA